MRHFTKNVVEFFYKYKDLINEKNWEELLYEAEMNLPMEEIGIVGEDIILPFDPQIKFYDKIPAHFLRGYSKPHFTIDSHLTGIGAKAFRDSKLEEIHIPSNIRKLGSSCFEASIYLLRVSIDEGVQEILNRAFYDCLKLETVSIPSTITKINALAFDTSSPNLEIYYNGTLEQWKKIALNSNWHGTTHGRLFCSNCNITF